MLHTLTISSSFSFFLTAGKLVFVCVIDNSELRDVVEDGDLLAWFERRQTNCNSKLVAKSIEKNQDPLIKRAEKRFKGDSKKKERTVRAISAPERIAQGATPAATRLALHCEVEFVQVLGFELQRIQILVRFGATRLVFGIETLGEPAGTVFAGTAFLARLGGTLGGC